MEFLDEILHAGLEEIIPFLQDNLITTFETAILLNDDELKEMIPKIGPRIKFKNWLQHQKATSVNNLEIKNAELNDSTQNALRDTDVGDNAKISTDCTTAANNTDWRERAERRARDECPYEIIPSAQVATAGEEVIEKTRLPGYLGTFGVDCKQAPDYMRLPPDALDQVKKLRRDVPEISPAAARVAGHPRLPQPDVGTCLNPPPEDTSPCATKKEEDVAFACPHVEPQLPCCDPDKRDK